MQRRKSGLPLEFIRRSFFIHRDSNEGRSEGGITKPPFYIYIAYDIVQYNPKKVNRKAFS